MSGDDSGDNEAFFQTPGQFANDAFLAEATAMIGAYASSVIVPLANRTSFLNALNLTRQFTRICMSSNSVLLKTKKTKTKNINDKKNEYQYAYPDALRLEILDALDACSLKSTKVSATGANRHGVPEEPAMASAFASALRAGKVSGFGVDGNEPIARERDGGH